MPKASPITTAFNAGELSPLLDGRVDLNKYPNGAHRLMNFIPRVQGPLERRGGTEFLDFAATDDAGDQASLMVEFVPTSSRPFALEFCGDGFFRVWFNGGRVLNAGVPVAVDFSALFGITDLLAADGTELASWAQSADVMYMTVVGKPPVKITRLSDTSWTIAALVSDAGPWRDPNAVKTTTIYASAQTGSVTLTASTSIFTSAMVGMLVRLTQQDVSTLKPWEPGQKNVTVGTLRRSDGKTYKATTVPAGSQPAGASGVGTNKWTQTGSVKPVHTEGKAYDGAIDTDFVPGGTTDFYTKGIEWQFQDPGYGVARITAFTSGTAVTATVITQLPAAVVGSGNPTWKWEFGAWAGDTAGIYPTCVAFWRERLLFAGGYRVWTSVTADFENFADQDFGEVLADSAFTGSVLADQANDIVWISAGDVLAIGTTGGEHVLQPASNAEPFGPANAKITQQSEFGSRRVRAIRAGQRVLFVQRGGRIARELSYDFGSDSFQSVDLTVLSEHITLTGLTSVAFSRSERILWYVRGDGMLIGLTYDKEQDVIGWHPHRLTPVVASSGAVMSVACVPSVQGDWDDLYLCIKRISPAAPFTVTYNIELLRQPFRDGELLQDKFYSDAALKYQGSPVTQVNGLGHLKGAMVSVLADGATHPDCLVDGAGQIQLQRSASTVIAGLPMVSEYQGMRLEAGAADGTAQGKIKRITRAVFRFFNTLGAKYGFLGEDLDTISFRKASDPMDQALPLFTGDQRVLWPAGYDTDARIYVQQSQPLPMTLVAIMSQVTTEDSQ